jgi:acetyl-CoA acetyltransferase
MGTVAFVFGCQSDQPKGWADKALHVMMSEEIAVVGVGDTDYGQEYRSLKLGNPPTTDLIGHAVQAFKAALADSGLDRREIDGLVTASLPFERVGEVLGMNLRWSCAGADPVSALILAIDAIFSGRAECIVLLKSVNFLSARTPFGGPNAMGAEEVPHYAYYRPWGFTSQGAFDAVVVQRYKEVYGLTDRQLGAVAVAQRAWAGKNPRAIMRAPMTIDEYLDQPFIVAPMRRPDYCVVADGAVALIVSSTDKARRLGRSPLVTIKGLGWGEDNLGISQLRPKLDFSRVQMRRAAEQVYAESGLEPSDMDAFYSYDNFSGELFYTLENFGYCQIGDAARFIAARGIGPGGTFPVNTSGGMMSEAYLQGWNAQVEAIRQLRGEAGDRQLLNCRHVQYVSNTMGKATAIIYGNT